MTIGGVRVGETPSFNIPLISYFALAFGVVVFTPPPTGGGIFVTITLPVVFTGCCVTIGVVITTTFVVGFLLSVTSSWSVLPPAPIVFFLSSTRFFPTKIYVYSCIMLSHTYMSFYVK
jgi:hypothetical protein